MSDLNDHRLLGANLMVIRDWLEATAFYEDLLAMANTEFESLEKPKASTFTSNANDSANSKNLELKMNSTQSGMARNSSL